MKNIANPLIEAATFQARAARLAGDAARAPPARPDLAAMSPFARSLHQDLERRLGTNVYLSWCACIEVVEVTDGTATLAVPTRFVKNWLSGHHADQIAAAAKTAQADVVEVATEVREQGQSQGETIQGRGGAPPCP